MHDVARILLITGLLSVMVAEGLGLDRRRLLFLPRRPLLLLRSLAAVVVAVPVLALLLARLLDPERRVEIGLAVLAACPAAPLALVKLGRAGSPTYAASLHLVLASLSIVTTPAVLFLGGRALAFEAQVSPLAVALQVGRTLLLPLGVGLAVTWSAPRLARRLRGPLAGLGILALLGGFALLLARSWRLLLGLEPTSWLALALLMVGSLAIGHLLARPDPGERTVLALECAVRNPGLALLVALGSFSGHAAAAVLLPYLALNVLVTGVYLAARRGPRSDHALPPPHLDPHRRPGASPGDAAETGPRRG